VPEDREILMALLREVSRQSEPFQSLIHDYSLDVMKYPEVHLSFTTRLNDDRQMLRRINNLKTLFKLSTADRNDISTTMNKVLEAISVLPATSHTNVTEITNLVACELAYRRMDQGLDEPLAVVDRLSNDTSGQQGP
jgi:hypothetical protein